MAAAFAQHQAPAHGSLAAAMVGGQQAMDGFRRVTVTEWDSDGIAIVAVEHSLMSANMTGGSCVAG